MKNLFLGIDIGSISVKTVLLDENGDIVKSVYRRMYGKPLKVLADILSEIEREYPGRLIGGCGTTGTGGELAASLVGGEFFNEIVAQSKAVSRLHPEIKTVIEMGGQDSKFITLKRENNGDGSSLEDFAMNSACAAGTGSFLDQQAARMGYSIEEEFAAMALKSTRPPRIAGRCSVFAKSDMIHLQQIGTPDFDIAAGLCYAVARSFKGNVAKGKEFKKPIAFVGGVAGNSGVVKAFEDELGLKSGELVIPANHKVTGAIGAALSAMQSENQNGYLGFAEIEVYLKTGHKITGSLEPLNRNGKNGLNDISVHPLEEGAEVFIGIDIGSLSTNVVAIDNMSRVVARRYIRTAGNPIKAVTEGLYEIGSEIGNSARVKGVGTTGSGRYMIADFAGADIVRNEITAQATAAVHFVPDVDTIFEIGGQDSKYVSLKDGVVVDFEMNKVCAAGTGSFIEEQAERLGLDIKEDFANSAFSAKKPGRFGERCTVFIESDLVSNQQKGAPSSDLAAGLAYSIVKNYLQVVGNRKIGDKILFQGGVAWNRAVVSAFGAITGKKITVPPHHDVTGAIGAALIAKREMASAPERKTRFIGFDLKKRKFKASTFECKACDNVCGVSRIKFGSEPAHYYGARCELFEKGTIKKEEIEGTPNLFAEREKLLFGEYASKKRAERKPGRKVVGLPRALFNYELFPFWEKFLTELGCEVILSGKTNKKTISFSREFSTAETCFPMKVIYGHVADLLEMGVDAVFMPSIISMNGPDTKFNKSHSCPYVQASPYMVKSGIDFKGNNAELWEPFIHFQKGDKVVAEELYGIGKKLGFSSSDIQEAVAKARKAQNHFRARLTERGAEIISSLNESKKAVVIISRPYNGCDDGLNMDLPNKLVEMGKIAVPMDMLALREEDVSDETPDMYWRSGQRMLAAIERVKNNPNLDVIFISNFKCGPDSFIGHHIQKNLAGKPCLQLEMDEHSADAGAITRCEAFFDSLENANAHAHAEKPKIKKAPRKIEKEKTLYLPKMTDHAYPFAAALNFYGQPTETLPETDRDSLDIGRKYSSGKECLPYTLCLGDIAKKALSSDFQPENSVFFMPASSGPCRFGQYNSGLRMALDRMGLENTELLTPGDEGTYGGLKEIHPHFRRLAWRGVVVVDILQKLVYERRPYEKVPGSVDSAYETAMEIVVNSIRQGGEDLRERMLDIRDIFSSIPIDQAVRRPIIGILGEIYVRHHTFSNQEIIRNIEALGAEARMAPFSEWIFYITERFIGRSQYDRKYMNVISGKFFQAIQKNDEKKLLEPFKEDLLNWEEPSAKELLALARPYLHESFEGEAILSIGKAIDYAEKGCSGIVNILPFSCMPGTVVTAISAKVRKDIGGIPWLNVDFDGVDEGNGKSRIEAFLFQAMQYKACKLEGKKKFKEDKRKEVDSWL